MTIKLKYLYGAFALIVALVLGAVLVYPDQELILSFVMSVRATPF